MDVKLTSITAAMALGASTAVLGGLLSKDEIKHDENQISATFKAQRLACDRYSGNAKNICLAEAKGNAMVANADLDARDKDTSKAREEVWIARAEATYSVAKLRCNEVAGNTRDVCLKDAQGEYAKAKADASLDRKISDTQKSANERIRDAQIAANRTKREADYKAARERCDSLAGSAKDSCIAQARAANGN